MSEWHGVPSVIADRTTPRTRPEEATAPESEVLAPPDEDPVEE
ncbi:hypothetical protein ACIA58_11120 [Kribbella sp. NPDC051586]